MGFFAILSLSLAGALGAGFDFTEPPESLPSTFLPDSGLVPLQEITPEIGEAQLNLQGRKHYVLPPIGFAMTVGEREIAPLDYPTQDKFFAQTTYAGMPKGEKIQISFAHFGKVIREVWDYPIGTLLVHRIDFKTTPPSIYELRLVWLDRNRQWHFSTYSPKEFGSSKPQDFLRNSYGRDHPPIEVNAVFSEWNPQKASRLSMKRINLASCQACHYSTSPSAYQYQVAKPDGSIDVAASIARTGPCGFTPNNPWAFWTWGRDYHAKHGIFPFKVEKKRP